MSLESNWVDDMEARLKEGIEFGCSKNFIHSGNKIVLVRGCKPDPTCLTWGELPSSAPVATRSSKRTSEVSVFLMYSIVCITYNNFTMV